MLFVVIFTDQPNSAHIRNANLKAHIEWLEDHRDVIPVGGSLRVDEGDPPRGGLWIAEAQSKSQVEALIQSDPFFLSGLRASYEVLHWSKANQHRKAII